jgi:hypothetical protein
VGVAVVRMLFLDERCDDIFNWKVDSEWLEIFYNGIDSYFEEDYFY